ncbi:MAG: gfo/Idh/MocA family oxidoreductase [Calditrichaeota bacterium]|nr:MAG: gfo/Idh/MocA family oxidoreductase [Calditrichota bacterium]MBL1205204.1 gfo/Idh/MocA family oxidoreductase [Calditrichota bacterium]NOG45034.1 Gfo/Idh/MocA family oxidoreductase [Calditrichota bacterium]
MENNENKKTSSVPSIDRRTFIKTSAAAGTGFLLSPMMMTKARANNSDALNIALLGTGAQGQVLMNACLKIPNIRFKAVCDIWTDYNQKRAYRLLKKYGHQLNKYEDYREMLAKEKELDAVIIATPDFWHAPHAEACLEAGLHVYCEKEMSNTLEGAKRIVRAAHRSKKLVQIGHQRRSNPRYIHSYNALLKQAKILGQITTVNGQWNRSVQPDLGWPEKYAIPGHLLKKYGFKSMQQFRNWRWYKGLGGGPIVDLGSHQLDIYNWFLDAQPISVMASGGTDYYDKKTHEWYDTVLATFEYKTDNGIIRAFYQTITTNSSQGYYENFMGDQGTLQISESASRGGVYREQSAPLWDKWVEQGILKAPVEAQPALQPGVVLDVRETIAPPKHELPVVFNDPYHKPHLENFFNAIRGEEELNCPVDIGYETAVTVLKVNEAVRTGRKVFFKKNEFTL